MPFQPAISCRYSVTGFIEELPQLPTRREAHACAALPDTRVRATQSTHFNLQALVVVGGYGDDNFLSSALTLLSGATAWTPLPSLPGAWVGAAASIVGGKLRVTGGQTSGGYTITEVINGGFAAAD